MVLFVSLTLHLEGNLRVYAIAGDLVIVDRHGEFFDVYRADVPQRLCRFLDNILRRVLPTLRRSKQFVETMLG
jgi:hypothetical protein